MIRLDIWIEAGQIQMMYFKIISYFLCRYVAAFKLKIYKRNNIIFN